MDAEVLVAQRMANNRSNSAYSSNGLRSRERPNKGMESNSLLHTVVVIYRFVVVFLDLASFWFKALFEFLRLGFLFFFPAHERSISGEVALVTGAGQGIGRALALDLAKKGAIVICVDIRTDTNEETVRLVQQNSGVAFAFTCDVAEREQVEDLAIKVKSEVGDISILINNAGVLYCRPFLQHSARQIENVISTNLMGQLWMVRAFLPRMVEMDKGSVVSLCSIAGHAGAPHMVPYSASKFAVKGMMEALHQELRQELPDHQIHFMTVSPFIVDTGMIKGASIRFPNLLNMVSATETAELIVKNLRKRSSILWIPSRYYYLHNFARLLPNTVQHLIMDFIDTGIDIHYDNTDNL